jgi:hypothetical protein
VSRAPGSHGGDQTSQQHQEPWCQSALPRRCAHAPARVAAAPAVIRRMPPMPSWRWSRRCCRCRPDRRRRAGVPKRIAAGRWWTRSGMWFITGACGGRCRPTFRPGVPPARYSGIGGPGTLLTTRFTDRCRGNSRYQARWPATNLKTPLPASGRALSFRAPVSAAINLSRRTGSGSLTGSGTIIRPPLTILLSPTR